MLDSQGSATCHSRASPSRGVGRTAKSAWPGRLGWVVVFACAACALSPPPARAPGFPCRCCPPNVALLQDPRAVAVSACRYFQPQQPLARCPYIHPPAFAANVAVAAVDWAYWDLRHPECDCLGLLRPTYRARPPPRYIPSGVLLRCVAPLCGGGVHPNRRTLCKGDMLSVFGEPPP